MRKFYLILSVLFLICLIGCGGKEAPEPSYAPVCSDGPTETATEALIEDLKGEDPKYLIETKYYDLNLPEDWADKCSWEIFDKDDGTYILNLYEKTSHEEMGAGKLCAITLLPTDEDWMDFPNYTMHGILYTPEGDFQILALFPTDVQFTEATADAYNALSEKIMDVLCTITPAGGSEMVAPAPVL